ncbi:hypothetical protein KKE99_00110, partial [Patescibacteria group bacterium]|nr:hypothetical protein [Patescibacteria group bacterium]
MTDKDKSFFVKIILAIVIFVAFLTVLGLMVCLVKNKPVKISQPQVSPAAEPTKSVEDKTADWKTYRNEEYGFEFKHPEIFDPNKNLIIRDWTINSEAGPDEFYFKVSQARWKNRLAHKIGYKKGDSCIDPDDVAPITDYDSSETNCIIYQLDNNYVIRYNDPDSVDYILILDKGEIIYT